MNSFEKFGGGDVIGEFGNPADQAPENHRFDAEEAVVLKGLLETNPALGKTLEVLPEGVFKELLRALNINGEGFRMFSFVPVDKGEEASDLITKWKWNVLKAKKEGVPADDLNKKLIDTLLSY